MNGMYKRMSISTGTGRAARYASAAGVTLLSGLSVSCTVPRVSSSLPLALGSADATPFGGVNLPLVPGGRHAWGFSADLSHIYRTGKDGRVYATPYDGALPIFPDHPAYGSSSPLAVRLSEQDIDGDGLKELTVARDTTGDGIADAVNEVVTPGAGQRVVAVDEDAQVVTPGTGQRVVVVDEDAKVVEIPEDHEAFVVPSTRIVKIKNTPPIEWKWYNPFSWF